MKHYTVVIADDHQIIRDGVRDTLKQAEEQATLGESARFEIVANAENGLQALAAVKSHQPDILFLDVSMPLATGTEILADIKRWSPNTKVLIFTGVVAPGLLASLVEAGVHGVFSKTTSTQLILEKLPLILQGGHFVAPDLVDAIAQGQRAVKLTDRERQTLNMILSGKSNKEMAKLLNISPKTVDKHRTSLMQKLEVHSIAELMARALQDGLVDPN